MGKREIIAFVPVRGGSKSIPLKNIKPFCGKPLVYWVSAALQASSKVDRIIVATDSDEISETVKSFQLDKVSIYRRLAENATDTASTESVMLEYIRAADLEDDTVMILAQATSPLTQTVHIDEALDLYENENYDSLLTCVVNKRFFWNKDGTSRNYDYKNRPRRQDFNGQWMENGAFYINSVKNIKQFKNRLSGKIGIYEMPIYSAFEIDEEDDWIILEKLMNRHVLSQRPMQKVKLFLSDVDGVLTDSGMFYGESGEESKRFNTRDGMGFSLLRKAGIKTGIITSESRKIVERRAEKLKVDFLKQGVAGIGKLEAAQEICREAGVDLSEISYVGDDLNCFELLSNVGLPACPADAADEILSIPGIKVLSKKGGEGCVREFIDEILRSEQ
ncbi:MAG: acylneuraminate cytidylyltransferase [Bacteroidales bacterium]|nr:acylneuraminate cytidylyltransferase [Bacteroidales bacterium]